jgi:hypothetical protein
MGPQQVYLNLPIIVYPSEYDDCPRLTAHCLNMDIVATDDTLEGAVDQLLGNIEATLEFAQKCKADVFRAAPEKYWKMFERAKAIPGELLQRICRHANKRNGICGRDPSEFLDLREVAELQIA